MMDDIDPDTSVLERDQRDAERWRALLDADMISIYCDSYDPTKPNKSLLAQFWTIRPKTTDRERAHTVTARAVILAFADAAIAAGKGH